MNPKSIEHQAPASHGNDANSEEVNDAEHSHRAQVLENVEYENVIVGDEDDACVSYLLSENRNVPSKKKSGIFGTSSNLVNTIVGAGIIGIPYAIRESGFIAGVILLILVGFLTDKTLKMLIESASFNPLLKSCEVTSYEDIMYFPFGNWGRNFIRISMVVFAFGDMIAYLLIIKDTFPVLIGFDNGFEKEIVLILSSLFIALPLSMLRDMASLAFTSLLSVVADTVLTILILVESPFEDTISENGGFWKTVKEDAVKPNLFIGVGVFSLAMCCQHSSFLIYGSLENNTRRRWATVSAISITYSTGLCLALGIFGYLGYLDDTEGDLLNNFSNHSNTANAARALLASTMFLTYPMESIVARHVLMDILYSDGKDHGTSEGDVVDADDEGSDWDEDFNSISNISVDRRNQKCKRIITLVLYVMALIPALIFNDLGPVLSIGGSLSGSCLAYIGPGLAFLGVNSAAFLEWINVLLKRHNERRDRRRRQRTHSSKPYGHDAEKSSNSLLKEPLLEQEAVTEESETEMTFDVFDASTAHKPLWWYCLGFPIWYRLATNANVKIKENVLAHYSGTENDINDQILSDANALTEELPHDSEVNDFSPPSGCDFFTSLFLIVFGVIALSAGLFSNIVALL